MTSVQDLTAEAVALAERWVAATEAQQSEAERDTTARLAALVASPAGLELALRFVDRVARPEDLRVAGRELAGLRKHAAAAAEFLAPLDRLALRAGAVLGPVLPGVVVPLARARLRTLVGHLVADAGPGLTEHLARARAEGFRLNLNLLGEAVLGEDEARSRLRRVTELAARPDVDYVSVKVSAVASQLSTWDHVGSVARIVERLRPLYISATANGTFVNLDMEEYRDLALTVAAFEQLALDPELANAPTGIVLQAYLPDSVDALGELAAIARRRTAAGGERIKIRLVKGANLAMERVEAELHGWPQAPYPSKADVDANYVRLLDLALRPEATAHVRIGAASHNLYHVALAHLLARERGVAEALDVEMLQGMAPAQARAVRETVGDVLLYTPVVAKEDFDVAISYLVRRLEENAAPENYLHALFAGGSRGLAAQRAAFEDSVRAGTADDVVVPVVPTAPRRVPRDPTPLGDDRVPFANTPDTDPAVAANREWALGLSAREVEIPPARVVATRADVDAAVERATAVRDVWASAPPSARARMLRRIADELEALRGDLVATMVREGAKTVAEADPEVSEAVDFARYYAERAEDLADGAVPGAVFRPAEGLTLVTPPWNFPVAIPVGSVLAALAAGSTVLAKPAPQTPQCLRLAAGAIHRAMDWAGTPRDTLQVLDAPEGEVGRYLVSHAAVGRVLLTGSIETARLFASWRPDLDVYAETSGKNALVVTPSGDLDLAVADVVRSAFGHSGQKCSAASLLILVGSAGRSRRLRRQLADAVRSLAVGPADEIGTAMGPLVEPAQGKLLRALTTLEPGESWLVEPRRLDDEGRLWSPGVKLGVRPGSFCHTTEVFGPVLGVMHAGSLEQALEWQNGVDFGLTGGIHTLDEAEAAAWLRGVAVGNAYINRHTTGAIVQRQPFGGWKASVVGPGAKAGGPDYVAQLGTWSDAPDVPDDDAGWLAFAADDDARCWEETFSRGSDLTGLRVEANVHRYRPVEHLWLRVGDGAREREVQRVLRAARRARVPVSLSLTHGGDEDRLPSRVRVETDAGFAARVASGEVSGRVRVVGTAPGLRAAAAGRVGAVTVLDGPVLASGRRELLTVLREQAVSVTAHRFGHVTRRRT